MRERISLQTRSWRFTISGSGSRWRCFLRARASTTASPPTAVSTSSGAPTPRERFEEVRFEHALVAHLRYNGFPAPVFVPCVSGGDFRRRKRVPLQRLCLREGVSLSSRERRAPPGSGPHPGEVPPDRRVFRVASPAVAGAFLERDSARAACGDALARDYQRLFSPVQ